MTPSSTQQPPHTPPSVPFPEPPIVTFLACFAIDNTNELVYHLPHSTPPSTDFSSELVTKSLPEPDSGVHNISVTGKTDSMFLGKMWSFGLLLAKEVVDTISPPKFYFAIDFFDMLSMDNGPTDKVSVAASYVDALWAGFQCTFVLYNLLRYKGSPTLVYSKGASIVANTLEANEASNGQVTAAASAVLGNLNHILERRWLLEDSLVELEVVVVAIVPSLEREDVEVEVEFGCHLEVRVEIKHEAYLQHVD
ncbi:hypothetical protein Tco_0331637 [Tanacetum coccineum]